MKVKRKRNTGGNYLKKIGIIIVMLCIGITGLNACIQNQTGNMIHIGSTKVFSGQKIVDIENYPKELAPFFKYFQNYLRDSHLNLADTITTIAHSENTAQPPNISDWTISLLYVRDAPARYNNRIYYQIIFRFSDATNFFARDDIFF